MFSSNERSNDDDRCEYSCNTTYVLNGERRVRIGYIDFNRFDIVIAAPEILKVRKISSGIDLAFKKMQVYNFSAYLILYSENFSRNETFGLILRLYPSKYCSSIVS